MLLGLVLSAQIVCQNGVISTNYSRILGVEFASSLTCDHPHGILEPWNFTRW